MFVFIQSNLHHPFSYQWLCLSKTDLSCHPQPQTVQHHCWWASVKKHKPPTPHACHHVICYNVYFVLSLLADPPSSAAGRTLTLVAKSVQNLANLVEFGAKVWIMYLKQLHEIEILFWQCGYTSEEYLIHLFNKCFFYPQTGTLYGGCEPFHQKQQTQDDHVSGWVGGE